MLVGRALMPVFHRFRLGINVFQEVAAQVQPAPVATHF